MHLKRGSLNSAGGRVFPGVAAAAVSLMALFGILSHAPAQSDGNDSAEDEKRMELHLYMKGRYVFQKNCVDCHGSTGRGNGPWAAELDVKPRNFRTGLFKFRTTPYGKLPVNDDLRRTIRSGISGTAMPVFSHLLDDEVDALIIYLQNLSRSWSDETLHSAPLTIPAIPEWFSSVEERSSHAVKGRTRFGELCAVCHGVAGKGDGPGGVQLVDAWEQPIRPANLSAPHHKSGDSPRDLYRTIATGMNGTPMMGFAGFVTEAEIWDLVVFILESEEKP